MQYKKYTISCKVSVRWDTDKPLVFKKKNISDEFKWGIYTYL